MAIDPGVIRAMEVLLQANPDNSACRVRLEGLAIVQGEPDRIEAIGLGNPASWLAEVAR
jgi:hypothetical protein